MLSKVVEFVQRGEVYYSDGVVISRTTVLRVPQITSLAFLAILSVNSSVKRIQTELDLKKGVLMLRSHANDGFVKWWDHWVAKRSQTQVPSTYPSSPRGERYPSRSYKCPAEKETSERQEYEDRVEVVKD